jgi:hypothetical protein
MRGKQEDQVLKLEELHVFTMPQFEYKLKFELEGLILTLCFLSLRWDLNHCPALPLIPQKFTLSNNMS